MWLAAANLVFLGGGFWLCVGARQSRYIEGGRGRNSELHACVLVGLLTLAGFLLAELGMNASWTGHAELTDLHWLPFALVFVAALMLAHVFMRLQASRADQLLLPVAAFLTALGLINIYVWETRDGNAYISTVALPKMRAYVDSVTADRSIPPSKRAVILAELGPVPNELTYERDRQYRSSTRFATVLNGEWLQAYNAAARRFERAARGAAASVHQVRIGAAFRKQALVAAACLLLLPLLLVLKQGARAPPPPARSRLLVALGLLLLAVSGTALLEPAQAHGPAVLRLGHHGVIAYELLKLALVVALAFALGRISESGRRSRDRAALSTLAAATLSVVGLAWQDHGSGLALFAVGVLMASLVVGRRWRLRLMVAATIVALTAPLAIAALGSDVSGTVRVRLAMWADPSGTYQRADLTNKVTASFERLIGYRTQARHVSKLTRSLGSSRLVPASAVERDVGHIEQEFRWRLSALQPSSSSSAQPFIPSSDPVDDRVLLEAENLWSGLGGYSWAERSAGGRRAFETIAGAALAQLRADADRLKASLLTGPTGEGPPPASADAPDDFQLQRSLFALRSGGLLGRGLGLGRPEALPGLAEDVPLASLGESLGFVGVALIGLLLLLIVRRGTEWGERERARGARGLLLIGLSMLFGLQELISLGGTSEVLPFTGLTFPFISRSGTALVADFLAVALMLALSEPGAARGGAEARGWRTALSGAGFPAAVALVLASIAVLQLGGRTLTPGSLLAALPGQTTPLLHADDQWDLPNYRMVAGPIVDRHGRALAETTAPGGRRVYPDTGVATSLAHTLLALDLAYRKTLVRPTQGLGRDGEAQSPPIGPTLVTTIDSGVQQAVNRAFDVGAVEAGLGNVKALRGAAVVLDVRTGAILALLSRPIFSLDELSDPLAWARAEARERRSGFPYRYLNRAIDGYYPPGSIFKTVTATAVLDTGLHTLTGRDFDYRSGPLGPRAPDGLLQLGRWQELALPDGPPITDGNHPNLPLSQWDFSVETAYAWSSNIAFAQMGLQLGAPTLVDYARRFGFERVLDVPGLGSSVSTMDNGFGRPTYSRYIGTTASALARSAFGQGQVRATPLQMALVPAAIADGGTIMQPYVIAGWKAPGGRWIERTRPRVFLRTGFKPRTIAEIRTMMRYSVTYGWAQRAKLNPRNAHPGVAGKTGSAEWSKAKDITHAWFIGYYPTESPRVALALIVERAGPGPRVSVRIAHEIFASPALHRYVRETGRP